MKILYVNAMESESSGQAFLAGVYRSLSFLKKTKEEEIEILPYDIFYGRRLSPALMGAFARYHDVDAVILSGSGRNTSDRDDPWLNDYYRGLRDLLDFRGSHMEWTGPEFPVFGICFGHQAMACALGGETSRFNLKADMVDVQALPSAKIHPLFSPFFNEANTLKLGVIHGDHVIRMPQGFKNLFTSKYCEIQGMIHDQWPIISVQSHPEMCAALKDAPDEKKYWEHLSGEQMNNHDGPRVLASFIDWAWAAR